MHERSHARPAPERRTAVGAAGRRCRLVALVAGPDAAAATSEGLQCETDPNDLLADRPRRLRLHPGRQLDLHVGLRHQLRAASSCPARRSASPPGRRSRSCCTTPSPSRPRSCSRARPACWPNGKPAQPQFTDARVADLDGAAGRGRRRLGDLHLHGRAAPAPTSTRAAPTSTSRCRWACSARWSSGPPGTPTRSTTAPDSAFNPGHEYVFLLSEVDPDVHLAVEHEQPVDWTSLHARATS